MKVGIFTFATDGGTSTLDELVETTQWAEEAGFASAWVPHLPWSHDSLIALAVAGRATGRIELGSAVTPTYPVHPMTMARSALSANAATGGRLALGLGPSHQSVIEGMYGLSYDRPAAHTRAYLEVVRAAFDGARQLTGDGEFFGFSSMFSVPDARPPQLLLAALAPMMLRLAGELADGTILWFADEVALETHVVPRITAAADAAGRPAPRIIAAMPISVCDDEAAGRSAAAVTFAPYGQIPTYRRMLDRGASAGPADVVLVGTEALLQRRLERWRDLGVTEFIAAPFGIGDDRDASLARTRAFLASIATGI